MGKSTIDNIIACRFRLVGSPETACSTIISRSLLSVR